MVKEGHAAAAAGEGGTRADLNIKLAAATSHYARKDYVQAAELYSEATEIQDELNGEMHPDNAHLLYLYGRCLYHVAVSKSDVLGGKVSAENNKAGSGDGNSNRGKKRKAEEALSRGESSSAAVSEKKQSYFQIEGDDADWDEDLQQDDEDEETDEEAADQAAEEEEDDFAIAYEVLDIARLLLTRQIEAKQQQEGEGEKLAEDEKKGAETEDSSKSSIPERPKTLYALRELLADTHDLQAEICLENERFEDAIADSTASLALKQELYPQESSLVAEAHYKLSLALEFASVTKSEAEQVDMNVLTSTLSGASSSQEQKTQDAAVEKANEEKREQAVKHMEAAIDSTKLRVKVERGQLASMKPGSAQAIKKGKEMKDVEEIIGDMEQRLLDLRAPPSALQASGDLSELGGDISGILGSLMGQAPTAQKAILEEAVKGANDLSGMVKRRKQKDSNAEAVTHHNGEKANKHTNAKGKAKRKMSDQTDEEAQNESDASKKKVKRAA